MMIGVACIAAFLSLVVAHSFAWGVVRTIGDAVEPRHVARDLIHSAVVAAAMGALAVFVVTTDFGWGGRKRGIPIAMAALCAAVLFVSGRGRFGYGSCFLICYPCSVITFFAAAGAR